jgi:hypothetical protein
VVGSDRQGVLHLWDVDRREKLFEFAAHTPTSPVHNARFSPDGKLLYSCGSDRLFKVWQLPENMAAAPMPAPGPVGQVELPKVLKPMSRHEQPDGPFLPFEVDSALTRQAAGSKVFLSDMREFAVRGSPKDWRFGKNGSLGHPQGLPVLFKGANYPKALGTHPAFDTYFRACYALGKKAKSLHGTVAIDDRKDFYDPQPTRFVILTDNEVRWRSNVIRERGVGEPFALDVSGVEILELRVYCESPISNGSWAVWLDPYVTVEGGSKQNQGFRSPSALGR